MTDRVDDNLKLVILDALQAAGLAPKPKRVSRGRLDRALLAQLLASLDAATWKKAEKKLEALEFDGGLAIYAAIYADWDGEDSVFDVKSWRGVERLAGLRSIDVLASGMVPGDLRPLARLPRLERLRVQRVDDASVFEEFPALRSLGFSADATEKNRAAVERLRARGVDVEVAWHDPAAAERECARQEIARLGPLVEQNPDAGLLAERACHRRTLADYAAMFADVDRALSVATPDDLASMFGGELANLRGAASFYLGRFEQACADYRLAIERGWPCHADLAEALVRLGRTKDAKRELHAAEREEESPAFIAEIRRAIEDAEKAR